MSDSKAKYRPAEYAKRKTSLHRVPLDLPLDTYEALKKKTEKDGIAINVLLKRYIAEYLEK